MTFATKEIGGTVLTTQFTGELRRAYQYDLAARGLQTTIRVAGHPRPLPPPQQASSQPRRPHHPPAP